MKKPLKFEGVFPILATPFNDDESLDLASLERLVRFMVLLGVDGVTVLGVLGESNRMIDAEREQVIATTVAAAGDCPVIVGASHSGTRAATQLAQMAQHLGAAAVMVSPQYEAIPNDQRAFEYFERIAQGVSIPLVVQDHPPSSQVHMPVALLLKLVREIPSVACVKAEAAPTLGKISALIAGMKERRVPLLTALGALYGGFELERGASGFNTGFAFPEILMTMVAHTRAGRVEEAHAIYQRILPLIVFEQQPGTAIRKELLRLRGLIAHNRVRHPGASIDAATSEQLQALIARVLPGVDVTKPVRLES
jgi:4-hydroxy-tetrahydrodipicolinate synthase